MLTEAVAWGRAGRTREPGQAEGRPGVLTHLDEADERTRPGGEMSRRADTPGRGKSTRSGGETHLDEAGEPGALELRSAPKCFAQRTWARLGATRFLLRNNTCARMYCTSRCQVYILNLQFLL